jgi:glutathione S-transferase
MAALAANVETVKARWMLLDTYLQGRFFMEADKFSLADIVLGAFAKRWFGLEGIERPSMPNLERWYQRLAQRSAFKHHIDGPLT